MANDGLWLSKGVTNNYTITTKEDGAVLDTSGWTIECFFRVRRDDVTPAMSLTSDVAGQIEDQDAANGLWDMHPPIAMTSPSSFAPGIYYVTIHGTDTSGDVHLMGDFKVEVKYSGEVTA